MKAISRLEQKLDFNQIVDKIKQNCLSSAAERLVDNIHMLRSHDKIERELNLTDEFLSILLSNRSFPSEDYFDMNPELGRLQTAGSFLSVHSLFDLWRSLRTIKSCLIFFKSTKEGQYPCLKSLCEGIEIDEEILAYCGRLMNFEGEILDTASDELFSIRSDIRRKRMEVDRRIRKLLVLSKQEGWSSSDAELTVKNGRTVIPVSSANKRRIPGFVHDESSSGLTSYIEPSEVVELNNELNELHFEQDREIKRILVEFSDFLRPYVPSLKQAYDFLARVDFIMAKAKYALRIKAGKPVVNRDMRMFWYEARHPVLQETLVKNNKSIVPLQVNLNEKSRILIISGPNAGGKSVCLKTVGLLQYMLQCGLLVPMKETSEVCIFDNIFMDIGDEQSLENDLSTYSSHLLNMKVLTEKANDRTLFLIDEFGAGTDPAVGGVIAEAVLEHLYSKSSFGIITTHYSNLKLFADRYEGITNAAMLFDLDNMRPLYKLSIGKPGSSFAFEIARTIGLLPSIIKSASEKIGSGFMDFEQALQQLEVDKMNIRAKEKELKLADELLDTLVREYESKNEELQRQKKQIIYQAKQEARHILEGANRQIEQTIAEIRTSKAEKEVAKKARQEIRRTMEEVDNQVRELKDDMAPKEEKKTVCSAIPLVSGEINENDIVCFGEDNNYAEVIKVRRNKVELVYGGVHLTLDISQVRKVDKREYMRNRKSEVRSNRSSYASLMSDINDLRARFDYQLDLRGQRADEALNRLSQYMDRAMLLGESEISVLHGKGDGILKTVIREFLKNCPFVESFKVASLETGGEGVTKIRLK